MFMALCMTTVLVRCKKSMLSFFFHRREGIMRSSYSLLVCENVGYLELRTLNVSKNALYSMNEPPLQKILL